MKKSALPPKRIVHPSPSARPKAEAGAASPCRGEHCLTAFRDTLAGRVSEQLLWISLVASAAALDGVGYDASQAVTADLGEWDGSLRARARARWAVTSGGPGVLPGRQPRPLGETVPGSTSRCGRQSGKGA